MKKRICILCLLTVFSVSFLAAKVKLTLDVGPIYTHFSSRTTHSGGDKYTWATHTGGLNVLLRAEFMQNFGVYGMMNFAFGRKVIDGYHTTNKSIITKWNADLTYAIDNQFGFFYVFHPVKKMDIALGFGIGIGGSGRNSSTSLTKTAYSQVNIGGGVNLDVSYMFTEMVGIYSGISDTLYAPVLTKADTTIGNKTTTSSDSNASGKIANSFSIKAGLQFVF